MLLSTAEFSEDRARRRIEAALRGLSADDRAIFVLYEMEGVPGKQIAEVFSCPEASVWRKLHYARQKFRDALSAESFEAPDA